MKNLMISTALAICSVVAAQADAVSPFRTDAVAGEVYASDFIGMRVYVSQAELAGEAGVGVPQNWADIGEINDVIMSRGGTVEAVLVDIGGFLGMGERQVAINMDALRFVSDNETTDNADDYFLVMTAADAMVKEAPEYIRGAKALNQTAIAAGPVSAASVTGSDDDTAPIDRSISAQGSVIVRDGYVSAEPGLLTTKKLIGAPLYGEADASIGKVSDLILNADGQITDVVVDVGGFLGMGSKPVALKLSDLTVLREEDGDDLWVYVSQTKDQLKTMPDYVK